MAERVHVLTRLLTTPPVAAATSTAGEELWKRKCGVLKRKCEEIEQVSQPGL